MAKRFLTAGWDHLLMINYAIDPSALAPLTPKGVELDQHGSTTFVSVVGFRFSKTRVLGLPIPFHTRFDEINLRFYVRRQVNEEVRRGVVFIKEIVPRWAIAAVARWLYNENYIYCRMNSTVQLPDDENDSGSVEYTWQSASGWNHLAANFAGPPALPEAGSEEEFITEHYWGYVTQRDRSTVEYQVTHPQWPVWQAVDAEFECNAEEVYGEPFAEALSQSPTSAFIARGSPVEVMRGERLAPPGPQIGTHA